MNRWGYLVTVLVVLALGAYAFWPSSLAGDDVRAWVGERPEEFTVVDPRWPQEVRGQAVKIGGHVRAIDAQAVGHLWLLLDGLSVPKAKVREGVTGRPAQSAYGIEAGSTASTPVASTCAGAPSARTATAPWAASCSRWGRRRSRSSARSPRAWTPRSPFRPQTA